MMSRRSSLRGSRIYKRMAVVEKERDQWVIPIDEIHGIHRYNHAELGRFR